MNFPKAQLRFLFLIVLTILFVQVTESVTNATPVFGAQRLRLRVDNNTLPSGATTKVYVEFLDREYKQVQNDRTRTINFQLSSAGGSGRFSPPQITVNGGAWSGETTFVSEGAGKLMLLAASDGMDSGQVLLLVTRPAQSFLSQMAATVTYAPEEFEIFPKQQVPVVANNKSPATFYVSFSAPPANPVTVRLTTTPAAKLRYGEKESFALLEVTLDPNKAVSDPIHLVSEHPGKITVSAKVCPRGAEDSLDFQFNPRRPSQIIFDCPEKIVSTQGSIPISLRFADDDGVPVEADKERHIGLSVADDSGIASFESDSVVMLTGQRSVQALFKLQDLPFGNELRLLAVDKNDSGIKRGESNIRIHSPIEKILVSGPTEVNRGRKQVKFTIRLADKNGKPLIADWRRKINLSVNRGRLDTPQVLIEKGQDSAVVTYYSPNTAGKFKLTAEGHNLESGNLVVNVIMPEYWLILFTLLGALMGGIARQLHKDSRFRNIRPRWIGEDLELGLLGRLACSIIGGLLLYWIVKLGLSQAFGLPILPATLDLGSKSAAIVLGCIGGFAGTLILQKSAERFFGEKIEAASPQPPSHQPVC